jgi:hypothetical protein
MIAQNTDTRCKHCEYQINPKSHTFDECVENIKTQQSLTLYVKEEEFENKLQLIEEKYQTETNKLLDSIHKSKDKEIQELKIKMLKVYDKSNKLSEELKNLNILLFKNLKTFDLVKIYSKDRLKLLCKEFGIPERGDEHQLASDLKKCFQ